jgi:type IV secretory pathway TraG/TraD family ATPase VirD4
VSGGRWIWDAYVGSVRAAQRGASASARGIDTWSRGRGARRGYLVPGDPAPPANAGGGYFDYRRVLDVRSVPQHLRAAPFSLGQFVRPAKGPIGPIGLPLEALRHHAIVAGHTGGGKTTGIVVPWVIGALAEGCSVVTVDVKGDLLDKVVAEVASLGLTLGARKVSLDYTRPATSVKWNWIAELDSDRAIENAVVSILGRRPPPATDPHFYQDSQILRGLFEIASVSPKRNSLTASDLLQLLKDQTLLSNAVAKYRSTSGALRLSDLPNLYPDDYAKRVTGVSVKLDSLARPSVAAVTGASRFHMQQIFDRPTLLNLVAPMQDGQMGEMLCSLFMNQLLKHIYDRFTSPAARPVLLMLDEAARLSERIDYEQVLSVARAAGAFVVVAIQDVSQFKDKDERSSILSNCATFVCLPGVSPATATAFSERLGQAPVETASVSRGPSPSGVWTSTTTSSSVAMGPVLGTREIMQPPFEGRPAVVHARDISDAPFIVDLTR